MRAAAAVEEREIEVDRLPVARLARRPAASPSRRSGAPRRDPRRARARRGRPGCGGTHSSGSTRVETTCALRATSSGKHALARQGRRRSRSGCLRAARGPCRRRRRCARRPRQERLVSHKNDVVELQVLRRARSRPTTRAASSSRSRAPSRSAWLSFSDIRLPERDFEGTAKQFSVAEPMAEHSLELTNRIEILRSARSHDRWRRRSAAAPRRQIRKLACVRDPDLGGRPRAERFQSSRRRSVAPGRAACTR